MALFQAHFWKDYVATIVITVVLGAAVAAGVAGGLDVAFGRALSDVLGPADEYGLLVHVRAEAEETAAAQVEHILAGYGDDLRVRQGVTVAGNANFLISIPERLLENAALEQLPADLQQLSGFNGHTWLLEPSVSVSGMRPAVRKIVAEQARSLPGVRAAVGQGTSLTVVLADESVRAEVSAQLTNWLEHHRVAEIFVEEIDGSERIVAELEAGLPPEAWRRLDFDGSTGDERLDRLIATMQRLPSAWRQLAAAGEATVDTLYRLADVVDGLQGAVGVADQPERQAVRIAKALRQGDGADAIKDVLLDVATSMLLQSLTGNVAKASGAVGDAGDGDVAEGEAPPPASPEAQLQSLRSSLDELADNVHALANLPEGDLEATMQSLEQLLPAAAKDDVHRLELLVGAEVSSNTLGRIVDDAVGPSDAGPRVFQSVAGVVNPNPRAMVVNLLVDVRKTIAALLALLIASFALVFDQAAIFAALDKLGAPRQQAALLAAGVGGLLFVSTYALAGGGIPLVEASAALQLGIVLLAGMLTGLVVFRLADRISPANEAELLAGRALGLTDGELLREIVVPAGRPGLLAFINKHRRRF